MTNWYVEAEFTTTKPLAGDKPFTVMNELGGIPMGLSEDGRSGEIGVTVEADKAVDAMEIGIKRIRAAIRKVGSDIDVSKMEVMTEEALEASSKEPLFPEVVGFAEIAKLAGVSRQRARDFAEMANFPKPVIETTQGPLRAKSAVLAWIANRSVKVGRPRKETPATA